jgi:hypothetical protein
MSDQPTSTSDLLRQIGGLREELDTRSAEAEQLQKLSGDVDARLASATKLEELRARLASVGIEGAGLFRDLRNQIDSGFADATVSRVDLFEKIKQDIIAQWTKDNSGPDPKQVFDDVESWVEGWFVNAYARSSAGWGHWCPEWWRHPEATERLTALWHSWEAAQKNTATGMAHWYVMYADPIFGQLTDSRGTFASCSDVHGRVLPSLQTITVEEGYPRLP